MTRQVLDLQKIAAILKQWGIRRFDIRPNEFIHGSPERALARTVVEDPKGNRYVLEQLSSAAFENKNRIAERIDRLHRNGLCVSPYLKGDDGHWIQRQHGFCWQLAPFIQGISLNRNIYWKEGWRGAAIGHFLSDLSMISSHWKPDGPVFSLPEFIDNLLQRIERNDPKHLPEIVPIADFLRRRFYPVADDVSPAFCHGDPHPLNTLWGEHQIIAVIDWEFCGWKSSLYDAALVVGCVGAEAPKALQGDFISAFLDTVGNRRIYLKEEMDLFPMFVLAIRFGWLSEWLRMKDVEMIEFERFYMNLLKTSYCDKV